MASEKESKINLLMHEWPAGTVAVTSWLAKRGVYQQLAYWYEKSGWLKRVGQGAYSRLNDRVDWTGGLYAVQRQLNLPIHAGGKTALEMRGFSQYIPARAGAPIHLFGPHGQRVPAWFAKYPWERKVLYFVPKLFKERKKLGMTTQVFGAYEIDIASPERAVLEVIYLVPAHQSVEEIAQIMEGLTALRPELMSALLRACLSVKVKRLFLALAARSNHPWFDQLNLGRVKLGTGKRLVTRGGVLDKKYQVTLPRLDEQEEQE